MSRMQNRPFIPAHCLRAVLTVLGLGLYLLGVPTPERM